MEDYIRKLRKKIGHERVILNYAGCIIIDEQNKILLQKRSDCGEWGFLGGLVELGESVEETAIREIKEECGLDVEITSLYGVYSKYFAEYSNGDKAQTIVHIFKAKVIGGKLIERNDETLELQYFDLKDVPPMFCKQHQDVMNDIIAGKEYVYR